MGYAEGKSWAEDVGEKLVRVVGFGALSDSGGFVLGLSTGGDSGRGVRLGKCCFPVPELIYISAIGVATPEHGPSGAVSGWYELVRELMGFERSGLGRGNCGIN